MIRPATDADILDIKVLMQSVPGFWHAAWRADVLERGIRSADGLAFVWEEAGQVLGFVCAHDVGFRAYLSVLVVADAARGRDIGKQLVRHVERELESRDCANLISDVWKDAKGFYVSLGWTQPDVVLFGKKLAPKASQQGTGADS